jgi:ATP-binding cassette, subfamily B, beta-glucan exporter
MALTEAGIQMREVLSRSLRYLRGHRKQLLIIALTSLLVAATRVAEPVLFGHLIDSFGQISSSQTIGMAQIFRLIAIMAVVSAIGVVMDYWTALTADRLVHTARWEVTQQYLVHVLSLSRSFHLKQEPGALSRCMIEANNYLYNMWLQLLREHAASTISIFIMLPVMVYLNAKLSLLLAALVVIFLAINIKISRMTDEGQGHAYGIERSIRSHIHDTVDNTILLQSYRKTDEVVTEFQGLVEKYLTKQFPVLRMWSVGYILTRIFSAVTLIAIFVSGTFLINSWRTTIGELVTFVGFGGLIIGRIEQLTFFVMQLIVHRQVMTSFFEVLDTVEEIVDRDDAVEFRDVAGAITFENVTFAYAGGFPAIRNLSFEIPAGKTVALVGGTGAGKTTIIGLLCRLWDPDKGRVCIDGIDIRDVTLDSLRSAIAIAFQESFVLHRSLFANVRLGKTEASDEEIRDLLAVAGLSHLLTLDDAGTERRVGQGGSTISGGERQRLSLVRALLKEAPILVLDEATSALDSLTEARIQQLVEDRRQGKTTLIVAHRLATVRNADLIIVLEDGQVIERGTYSELKQANGWFSRVVAAQTL